MRVSDPVQYSFRDEDDKGPQVTPPDTPPSAAKLENNIAKDQRQH